MKVDDMSKIEGEDEDTDTMSKLEEDPLSEPEPPSPPSRWQIFRRWIMTHKIETTAVIVVIVGIVVITMSLVNNAAEQPAVPQKKPPVEDTDGTHTGGTPPGDNSGPGASPQDPVDPVSAQPDPSVVNSPIFAELALLTDPSILEDPHSPQYKAARWLIMDDPLKLTATSVNLRQRYALATLYTATGGSLVSSTGWKSCGAVPPLAHDTSSAGVQCIVREGKVICADKAEFEGCSYVDRFEDPQQGKRFMSGIHECGWYGIECDQDSNTIVQKINIVNNELSGMMPSELALMTALTRINLSHNNIGGTIPAEIGLIETMREFLISSNQASGPIPASLYDLWRLKLLELEDNQLTGTLSPNIKGWRRMRNLYLDRNQFDGEIPTEIGYLSLARSISLHNNVLEGPIPTELALLETLEVLKLANNKLVGSVDQGICHLSLSTLNADCLPSPDDGDVAVKCDCCTSCCAMNSNDCVDMTTGQSQAVALATAP